MDSSRLHPQHVKLPFHCYFAKLSFVIKIFLVRYHITICIFKGSLSLQIGWSRIGTFGAAMALYIERTVYRPFC
jgi:hypothetical protein